MIIGSGQHCWMVPRNKDPLTKQEAVKLLRLVLAQNDKRSTWVAWQKEFDGRSDLFLKNSFNSIKNRWKLYQRATEILPPSVWIPEVLEFIDEHEFQVGVSFADLKKKRCSAKRRRVDDLEESEAASAGCGAGGVESESESEDASAGCGAGGAKVDFDFDFDFADTEFGVNAADADASLGL